MWIKWITRGALIDDQGFARMRERYDEDEVPDAQGASLVRSGYAREIVVDRAEREVTDVAIRES